jgi:hypothetical protein
MEVGEKGEGGDIMGAIIKKKKDIPTIKHKLAVIIPEDKPDEFAQKENDTEPIPKN